MPTVHYNKDVFEHYVGEKLPLDELKDRISFLGTDLESIEDNIITVEVFPNRPDMLSVQGFARAFSSFIGHAPGLKEYKSTPSHEKVIVEKAVSSVRPYTSCAIVKGMKFDDEKIKEVIDIQEKLHITYGRNRKKVAIGIYPFERIKTPIRFTAMKPKDIVFRPLDFDKELTAIEILEKHPAGQAYGHLLQGKTMFPVFLDADDKVLSIPPIINSEETGRITEKTTDIFIECSGFEYELLSKCLNMILTALADMGGHVYSMQIEYPDKTITNPEFEPGELSVNLEYINKRLGLEIKEKELKPLLERMGYGYKNGKVLIPCYRADILHQIDIAEDVAIAHGFENFEEIIPNVATIAQEAPKEVLKRKIAELLVGLGLQECATYSLTNEEHQSLMMNVSTETIKLANAVSLDYNVLRSWLLPDLMEILRHNSHYEYPQKLFTFGIAFSKDDTTDTGVGEKACLALVSCHEKADYTEARQIVEYILESFGLQGLVEEHDHPSFIPGRSSIMKINDERVALLGELSPHVLRNWSLEMPTIGIECSLDALFEHINSINKNK
jgi:phenylalanyl-tRNA synthetase beta chain